MTTEARAGRSAAIESALTAVGMAAIGIAAVVAGTGPMFSATFSVTTIDDWVRIAAHGFFAAVVLAWLGLFLKLLAIDEGRRYLTQPAEVQLGFYLAGRAESITIAGLVLAALTLGRPDPEAASLLTVALASFLVLFAMSSSVGLKSSDVVGAAVHWIGMAALVGGVSLVPATASAIGRIALLLGGAAIALYSIVDLRSRNSDAFPGTSTPATMTDEPATPPSVRPPQG